MRECVRNGYAKINLHLDVTGVMENGFHSVRTVMQSLSLCDTVKVTERADTEIRVYCDVLGVPCDERNLAYRAARAYLDKTGLSTGVDVTIEKRIPMAAGLAGGSADAAATLLALNELCGGALSTSELCGIASSLGSDVPFCVVGGTALGEGKGDVLTPLCAMPDCTVLVACGGEGVSTPWAYKLLDERYGGFASPELYIPHSTDALLDALRAGDACKVAKTIYNIFEEPVLAARPVATELRQIMLDSGASGAMMSGSGPSVFGIFTDTEAAHLAAERVRGLGVTPHICKPIR